MNECAYPACGKRGAGYLVCSGCKQVHYCTKECQVAHWKGAGGGAKHKVACSARKKAAQSSKKGAKGKSDGLKGAAEGESGDGRLLLDGMPQDGPDGQARYAEALNECSLAAEQGDAQYNLGVMFYHGNGVPKDFKKAFKHYRLAAEQGHAQRKKQL